MYFFAIAVGIAICTLISTLSYIQTYRIVRQHQIQDSRSTTGCAESKCWRRREHHGTEDECYEHLYILHVYDPMLFSSVNLHVHFSDTRQSINCLELCRHCLPYEFLYQSIFVLLATERASSSNFKNHTKYVM